MSNYELLLLLGVYLQPPILACLFFFTARVATQRGALYASMTNARRRLKSVRFFECAAYARALVRVRYSVSGLGFCALFLIYDVDVILLLPGALTLGAWTAVEAAALLTFGLFFLVAIWYDATRHGLLWTA